MRLKTAFICISTMALAAFGCQQHLDAMQRYERPSYAELLKRTPLPPSRTLTLSNEQLITLDFHGQRQIGPKVVGKRDVPGPGVAFDIYFPSNKPGHRSINFVSSGEGGFGTLVGADVRDYKTFALKFTLVSVAGQSSADITQQLVVGPLIGPTLGGLLYDYKTVTLGLAAEQKSSVVKMPINTYRLYQIGFHAHMLNPIGWNPDGTMVTLLLEPAEDAGPVPWLVGIQTHGQ
ncbi:MAG: hypothetical protein ACYS0C_10175 [Planctomycetota bacterium]|jgi:hypothetical protein